MTAHRRDHPVGISAEALALAWARQERAPAGATVVVGQEVSPRGFRGRLWTTEPEQTVALAVVLRPELSAAAGDGIWLVAGLATREALADARGRQSFVRWPDAIVDQAGAEVAMVKVEVQLGPAGVQSAVVTVRIDLRAAALPPRARAGLTEAVPTSLVRAASRLETDAEGVARSYSEQSDLTGRRVKADLLPDGEARGIVHGFDGNGSVLLGASPDLCDRIAIDAVRRLHIVEAS
ncbi:MAG: hypothetical protein ACR2JF_05005 [Iamia sp.]